jgi:preprotein translocase subunit YajC
MYATIAAVDGDDVILEVAPGVETRFMRRAIMEVLPDGGVGTPGPGQAGQYSGASHETSSAEEPADSSAVTAEAEDGGTTPVADTASEKETTDEAGTPSTNGMNPADEGRRAGR